MRDLAVAGMLEMAFEAFGVRVAVRSSHAVVLERLLPLLPPGWKPCPPDAADHVFAVVSNDGGERFELRLGEPGISGDADLELSLALLATQVKECVGLHAPGRIFVHAGVVGGPLGAVVLPGASFAGKSTLVDALVRAGATYYSDEFAVLDADGRVHPYPSPLWLRSADLQATPPAPAPLGGAVGSKPLTIATILVTTYRPGAEFRPRRLSSGEAMMALLANTLPAQERPQESMHALARAAEGVPAFAGERGDAETVARAVLGACERGGQDDSWLLRT